VCLSCDAQRDDVGAGLDRRGRAAAASTAAAATFAGDRVRCEIPHDPVDADALRAVDVANNLPIASAMEIFTMTLGSLSDTAMSSMRPPMLAGPMERNLNAPRRGSTDWPAGAITNKGRARSASGSPSRIVLRTSVFTGGILHAETLPPGEQFTRNVLMNLTKASEA
jgi:hypothetical protein